MKFKQGDKVKVVSISHWKGQVGIIIMENCGGIFHKVKFSNGDTQYYRDSELLTDPPTFKKGDEVIPHSHSCANPCSDCKFLGEVGEIQSVVSGDIHIYFEKFRGTGSCYGCAGFTKKDLTLAKEGTMNLVKEINLRNRIEAVTGWDKEADDIRVDIQKKTNYGIRLYHYGEHIGGFCIFDTIKSNIQGDSNTKAIIKFDFNTQCSKFQAFKKALLWLLDKSGIDKKQTKIKELEERMEKIQQEIEELKG